MIEAARCPNELERLCALHSYEILDTDPDPAFDSLVELAARLLRAKMALITLVDVERQWFKARVGCDLRETPRQLSFCAHALLNPTELLVIPDARLDPRFSGHPAVGQPDGICFYAGAPLVDRDGFALGTLCVVDSVPRSLKEDERNDLETLARHVIDQLELHRSLHRLEQAHAAEKRAAAEYLEAARVKSLFYATLTHEIRSPLTGIIGHAEMLQDPMLEPSEAAKCTRSIVRGSRHLLQVVNELLDLAKAEAGKIELEMITVDVAELLEELEQFALTKCEEKDISFTISRARSVPDVVKSDPTRLRQVLFNLLSNAIKFTEIGTVRLEVDYSNRYLSFAVRDSGIGLTDDQISRIFEPFAQADSSTTRRYGGTGLGLAICNRIAESFGGTLSATSTPGEGTIFTFTLPTSSVDTAPEPIQSTAISAPVLRGRVLVADDCEENCDLLRYFLEKEGLEVVTVGDGVQAVEAASSTPVDLIFMDLNMPRCNGVDAVRRMRRLGIRVPIVALTASVAETDRLALLDAGCNDSLAKPFKRSALLSKVASHLASEPSMVESDPMFQSIVATFLSRVPERLLSLDKHFEQQSWSDLGHAAHALAGAGMFGFHQLGEEALLLQRASVSGDPSRIKSGLDAVHQEVRRLLATVQGDKALFRSDL